jgi:hypothetical protein
LHEEIIISVALYRKTVDIVAVLSSVAKLSVQSSRREFQLFDFIVVVSSRHHGTTAARKEDLLHNSER